MTDDQRKDITEGWMTVREVTELMGKDRSGIKRRLRNGSIPGVLRGTTYLMRREDVEKARFNSPKGQEGGTDAKNA